MHSYNQSVLAYQHGQQVDTEVARSGMDGAMRAIFGTVNHPEMLHDAIGAQLGTLSPEARARDEPYLRTIERGLLAGLPPDTRQWTPENWQQYNQHVTGFGIAGQANPDQAYSLQGIPKPELGPTGYMGYGPGGQPLPSQEGYGYNAPGAGRPGAPGGTPGAPETPAPAPQGPDGKPLWDETSFQGATRAPTYGGHAVFRTPAAEKASDDFYSSTGKDYQGYESAMATAQSLNEFEHDLNMLTRPGGGGIVKPGSGGGIRTELAARLQAVADILDPSGTGKLKQFINENIGSKDAIAAAQDLQKITTRLAFSLDNQFFGQGRTAAQTVNRTFAAVPGIDNPALASKLMLENIRAQVERGMLQRQFIAEWGRRTGGDVQGAMDRFNVLHPPEQFSDKGLRAFGIDPKTYKFLDAGVLKRYVDQGYLTPTEASARAQRDGLSPPSGSAP
jgi:hypothetical protein